MAYSSHPMLEKMSRMRDEATIRTEIDNGEPITKQEAKYMNKKWLNGVGAIEKNVFSKLPLGIAMDITNRGKQKETSHFNVLETVGNHGAWVMCMAVMKDGSSLRIVTGARDNMVKVWSERTDGLGGWTHVTLKGHKDWVFCLGVLPGPRIVSGSNDKSLIVWNGSLVQERILLDNTPMCLAVFPDGRFVCGFDDKRLTVWKQGFDGWVKEVTLLARTPEVECLTVLANRMRGHRILCGSSDESLDSTLQVWRENGPGVWNNEATLSHVDVNYSHDDPASIHDVSVIRTPLGGDRIVTACDDNTVKVWNEEYGEWGVEATLEGHRAMVLPGPAVRLVIQNELKEIEVWQERSRGAWSKEAAHGYMNDVFTIAVMPDSRIVTSDYHGMIHVLS